MAWIHVTDAFSCHSLSSCCDRLFFSVNIVQDCWVEYRKVGEAGPARPGLVSSWARNWTSETNQTQLEKRFLFVAVSVCGLIICKYHLMVLGVRNERAYNYFDSV